LALAGLRKLKDTFDQVAIMQKELAGERAKLAAMDAETDAVMNNIVKEKTVANEKKAHAEKLAVTLEAALGEAATKKESVQVELAEVEPAVKAAEDAVGSIDKGDLNFIRSLAKPHQNVRNTCEAVCVMLGEGKKAGDWKSIQGVMRDANFQKRVMSHRSEDVTEKIKAQLKTYTDGDEEQIKATAARASKATGQLMIWVLAKLKQITVLLKIEPLRNELAELTVKTSELQTTQDENLAQLKVLEERIVAMKKTFGEMEARLHPPPRPTTTTNHHQPPTTNHHLPPRSYLPHHHPRVSSLSKLGSVWL
jgi:chromosome segregation ATPase